MTREEAIEKLKEQQNNSDIESAHYDGDNILCEFLKSIGYGDVVCEYKKINKWYS